MADTEATSVVTTTLAVAAAVDTITFNNYPEALRVTSLDDAERCWVTVDGSDPAPEAAGSYLVPPGGTRVLRCPKQKTVVLSFVGEAAETPEITVERVRLVQGGEYVSG